MSLAKELAKLRAALDAPWPEEIWKAKAEIAERELSATKDEYCKTAFALTEQTERAEKAEAEVERLTDAIKSCWHAANTYDGNHTRACDNVMTISSEALDPTDK